jgi:hypothetical protein
LHLFLKQAFALILTRQQDACCWSELCDAWSAALPARAHAPCVCVQVKMCCDDAVMWGALAVSLMCSIQSGRQASPAAAAAAGDDGDAAEDDDLWVAESIARAQHCFATAHKLDPKNVDNLCNYAVFSSEIAGDASRAKGLRAPWMPPMPAFTARNRAVRQRPEVRRRPCRDIAELCELPGRPGGA